MNEDIVNKLVKLMELVGQELERHEVNSPERKRWEAVDDRLDEAVKLLDLSTPH
jgi:hypothetical protein